MEVLGLSNPCEPAYIGYAGQHQPSKFIDPVESTDIATIQADLVLQYLVPDAFNAQPPPKDIALLDEIIKTIDAIKMFEATMNGPKPPLNAGWQYPSVGTAGTPEKFGGPSSNQMVSTPWCGQPCHTAQLSCDGQSGQPQRKTAPSGGRSRQRRCETGKCTLLIATQLTALSEEDPQKIIIVRKIHRLGFESDKILAKHFSRFGTVAKVLLSSAHKKPASSANVRLRPSGIGFILFERAEDALAARASGESQVVAGVTVQVQEFKRTAPSKAGASEHSDGEDAHTSASASTTDAGSATADSLPTMAPFSDADSNDSDGK